MHTFFVYFAVGVGVLNVLDKGRRHFGLHHPSKFLFAHKTICLPKTFRSPLHREAFAAVGKILTDPGTEDLLMRFTDQPLLSGAEGNVPLRIWHEVLEFYWREGVMDIRYVLAFRREEEEDPRERPYWDAQGKPRPYVMGRYGRMTEILPEMKEAEMRALIGTSYARHPLPTSTFDRPMMHVTLSEEDFLRVYYRPLDVVAG